MRLAFSCMKQHYDSFNKFTMTLFENIRRQNIAKFEDTVHGPKLCALANKWHICQCGFF